MNKISFIILGPGKQMMATNQWAGSLMGTTMKFFSKMLTDLDLML